MGQNTIVGEGSNIVSEKLDLMQRVVNFFRIKPSPERFFLIYTTRKPGSVTVRRKELNGKTKEERLQESRKIISDSL